MSVGIYGTKKLADITSDDVDVLYAYSPSREDLGEVLLNLYIMLLMKVIYLK